MVILHIILIILVIILSLYLGAITFYPNIEEYCKNITITPFNQIKNINNGDLIFLSGNTAGERLCKSCCMCMFSHVGMLFVENNIIYIIDCDLGQKMRDGVRVQKLDDKLKHYHGSTIGALRKIKKQISLENILSLVEKYKNVDFDNTMLSWVFCNTPLLKDMFSSPTKMFCSEFIARLSVDLNLLNKSIIPTSFSPTSFYNGYDDIFDKPILFKFK